MNTMVRTATLNAGDEDRDHTKQTSGWKQHAAQQA
jgi:hypothetical protein